jgi:hypothetical protein
VANEEKHRGYSAIEGGMLAYVRADAVARRVLEGMRRGLGALLAESLSPGELRALSVRLYGVSLSAAGPHDRLFDWEVPWFQTRLPPPPARLFVGGAGAGREVLALAPRGYEIDALEPAAVLVPRLAESGARLAVCASYEELADAVGGGGGEAAVIAGRTYDAVLLGWGSLTHVMRAEDRVRVLVACTKLTRGPILASFWMKDHGMQSIDGRAVAIGRRAGRALARLRGAAPAAAAGEPFAFGHAFERDEIEALGRAIGRRVAWDGAAGEYPHATFLP